MRWISSAVGLFAMAMGVALPAFAQTCSSITIPVSTISFVWTFGTTYGAPECGQFANGDWWVSPAAGHASVIVNSVALQTGSGNLFVDENPQIESIGFLTGNYGNKNISENIQPSFPKAFSNDTSLVAVVERDEAVYGQCGTSAIVGSCVGAYNVLTVLKNVPPGGGADILRPSMDETKKRLISMNDFDWSRFPQRNYFPGTSAAGVEKIRTRWSHATEIFSIRSSADKSYSEGGRAFRASFVVPNYAAQVGAVWNNDLAALMSDKNNISDKKPALAAMLVYGKDLYDAVYEGNVPVRGWGGGAGQGLNKFPPAVLYAALAKDPTMGQTLKDTTLSMLNTGDAPQELEQINIGKNGPVWGDSTDRIAFGMGAGSDLNRYWGGVLGAKCFEGSPGPCETSGGRRTVRDPYGFIDGPEALPGTSYMGVAMGQERAFLAMMSLIPQMCEIVNYPSYAEYIDRTDQLGIQAQPDPCAPPDVREPPTCDAYRVRGCNYYGLNHTGKPTWGPDADNQGMCILDPDLAYYNSPTDFACQPGKKCGRFPDRHGVTAAKGTISPVIEAQWDKIRAEAVGLCKLGVVGGKPNPTPTSTPNPTPRPNPTSFPVGQSEMVKVVFNPMKGESGVLKINLESPGHVTATVYSRQGTEVVVALDADKPAGPVEIVWNGRNRDGSVVASGVYMVTIKYDGKVVRQKLVVVK